MVTKVAKYISSGESDPNEYIPNYTISTQSGTRKSPIFYSTAPFLCGSIKKSICICILKVSVFEY